MGAAVGSLFFPAFNALLCLNFNLYCPAPTDGDTRFSIELVNVGTVTDYDDVFRRAADRWQEIIVNDLPDIDFGGFDLWFGSFGLSRQRSGRVDDLMIGYEFTDFDGPSIGTAGPRFVRIDGTTISGVMRFKLEFFQQSSRESAYAVILHEIGHVLGLGTSAWESRGCSRGCARGTNNVYQCPHAQAAYADLGFPTPSSITNTRAGGTGTLFLQIESEGDRGSRCSHFDAASFDGDTWTELMIPYIDGRRTQLITTVTLAALQDLGAYQVDWSKADPIPIAVPIPSIPEKTGVPTSGGSESGTPQLRPSIAPQARPSAVVPSVAPRPSLAPRDAPSTAVPDNAATTAVPHAATASSSPPVSNGATPAPQPERPSVAPWTPSSSATQTPSSSIPQTPSSSIPQTPSSSAPRTPSSSAPQNPSPSSASPQNPFSSAPQSPASSVPQIPSPSSAPWAPLSGATSAPTLSPTIIEIDFDFNTTGVGLGYGARSNAYIELHRHILDLEPIVWDEALQAIVRSFGFWPLRY